MAAKTLTIDGKQISAEEGATILQAATEAGIKIPTLCHLEGVYDIGACRLCIVEITGVPKLLPACTTKISEGMDVKTDSERLAEISAHDSGTALCRAQPRLRRVCVQRPLRIADAGVFAGHGACPLRLHVSEMECGHNAPAVRHGPQPLRALQPLRPRLLAHRGRRHKERFRPWRAIAKIITDLNMPWGDSDSCTECGKCVMACPTGALFNKGSTVAKWNATATSWNSSSTPARKNNGSPIEIIYEDSFGHSLVGRLRRLPHVVSRFG